MVSELRKKNRPHLNSQGAELSVDSCTTELWLFSEGNKLLLGRRKIDKLIGLK